MPDENYLYFGDLKNSPYGAKSKEELLKIVDNIFQFFMKKEVKAIVMACNTTSATTYDEIKEKYNVKVYPIIQSCAKILAGLPINKLGVFATQATINSHVYKSEIAKYNKDMQVFEIACPEWVSIVENNLINDEKSKEVVKKYADLMMQNGVEKIVLGCTHYPYLKETLIEIVGKDIFIDPAEHFAQYIKEDLAKEDLLKVQGDDIEEIFVSANPEEFKLAAKRFYEVDEVKLV